MLGWGFPMEPKILWLLMVVHFIVGAVALSLHYANVIIIIEKLVASPH